MMNTYQQDILAPSSTIPGRGTPEHLVSIALPQPLRKDPVEWQALMGKKPLAQSIRQWRGEADGGAVRQAARPRAQGGIEHTETDVDALKRTRERLEIEIEAAACAAESLFLSSVSHELRTPPNAIMGFTQMMAHDDREPLTARQREYLEIVFQSAGHLLDLVSRVLDLQKIEVSWLEIELAPVNVIEIVQESMDTLALQAAARGILINGETLCDEATAILADPIRFRQVMTNFLSNAIQYNRPGGHVWVTCAVNECGCCRIGVKDTGTGIPHHRRDEVFKPFNRLGREAGRIAGTGMGLAISKDLVERMGGRIGFESDPGRGSTFWVEMPLAADCTTDAKLPTAKRFLRKERAAI